MEDLVLKNASSLIRQYFSFKAEENGEPKVSNEDICRLCRKQVMTKQGNTTNLQSPPLQIIILSIVTIEILNF